MGLENVAGWTFAFRPGLTAKSEVHAGLAAERKEQVLATLPGERFPYQQLRNTLVRLVREIHKSERSGGLGSGEQATWSQASSGSHSRLALAVGLEI